MGTPYLKQSASILYWGRVALFSSALIILLIVPGYILIQVRQNRAAEAERLQKYAGFAKNHGVTLATVADLEKADKMAESGDVGGAWNAFGRLQASPDPNIRYEAYRSLASWWRFPKMRDQVHARIEDAKRDPAPKVRNSYPLLLILCAAPGAIERATPYTKDKDPEVRKIAEEAISWARQHGVGTK